jgi:hypothetical protein
MNLQKILFTFLLLAGTSLTLSAAEPLQIVDRGLDGNERYYVVSCPDNTIGTVKIVFDFDPNVIPEVSDDVRRARINAKATIPKIVQVCVFPSSGVEQCRNKWDMDAAAVASCQKSALPPLTEEQKKVLERPRLGV